MPRVKRDSTILALLVLLTTIVYANSLDNPFVIDDQHIVVRNFLLREWALWDILKSHLFAPLGVETQYYRPLTLLTFAINYGFSGLNPAGYHVFNLALHLLVVTMAYLLLAELVPFWLAAFSAALFAVHPANVQAVSYISSRSDPLYTALTLLTLLLWIKGNRAQGGVRILFLAFSLISFFLGLLAKETAIVAPALVILTDWLWHNDGTWKEKLRRNWLWYLGFGAMLSVYLTIRLGFAGYALNMEASQEVWKPGRDLTIWPRILLALQLLKSYLALALYPVNLSFFRSVEIPESSLGVGVLLGASSLALMITLAWLFWSRRKEIPYGILWFLISIVPVLNLTSLNAPMMEHWLYLPLIGFALAFAGCLYALAQYLGEFRGATFGLALLVILLSARTASRNAEWRYPIILFQTDARRYPNEEKNWFLLGYAYFERRMAPQAILAFQKGLAVNPNHAYAWSGLGETLSMAGKDEEAEKCFLKAISIMPENPWLHYVLGIHGLKTGKASSAVEALSRAVSLRPPLPTAYHLLGSAYMRQGNGKEAERAFGKALSMLPRDSKIHSVVHVEMGKLYLRAGKVKEAKEEWLIALRFDPNDDEAKALLQREAQGSQARNP
jgi:tetratricopeptide (TPR) repeat protein